MWAIMVSYSDGSWTGIFSNDIPVQKETNLVIPNGRLILTITSDGKEIYHNNDPGIVIVPFYNIKNIKIDSVDPKKEIDFSTTQGINYFTGCGAIHNPKNDR